MAEFDPKSLWNILDRGTTGEFRAGAIGQLIRSRDPLAPSNTWGIVNGRYVNQQGIGLSVRGPGGRMVPAMAPPEIEKAANSLGSKLQKIRDQDRLNTPSTELVTTPKAEDYKPNFTLQKDQLPALRQSTDLVPPAAEAKGPNFTLGENPKNLPVVRQNTSPVSNGSRAYTDYEPNFQFLPETKLPAIVEQFNRPQGRPPIPPRAKSGATGSDWFAPVVGLGALGAASTLFGNKQYPSVESAPNPPAPSAAPSGDSSEQDPETGQLSRSQDFTGLTGPAGTPAQLREPVEVAKTVRPAPANVPLPPQRPKEIYWGDPDRASDFFRASKQMQEYEKNDTPFIGRSGLASDPDNMKRGGTAKGGMNRDAVVHKALEIIHHMLMRGR